MKIVKKLPSVPIFPEVEINRNSDSDELLVNSYGIKDIRPNPFNPATTIEVILPEEALLQVAVYNILGQRVALLADREYHAGEYSLIFDGSQLTSGLYFVHVVVPDKYDEVRKLTLLK